MFYLAGLYSEYMLDDGVFYPHFVVLTMDANSSVSDVHDRMPVVLCGKEYLSWLENGELDSVSPMFAKRVV